MPTVITYDLIDEKQKQFKDYLINNKGWTEHFTGGLQLPQTTLIKVGTSNGNSDVLNAIKDIKEAEQTANTRVKSSLITSTNSAIEYYQKNSTLEGLLKDLKK